MTLNELANEIINHRGYLVICTLMDLPSLPYSLKRGLCEKDGEAMDSSCLYAYERTDLADYETQAILECELGSEQMIDPIGNHWHFYRVRAD